jgi:hypothetical protein
MIIIPLFGFILYTLGCLLMAYLGRNGKFAFWGNFFVSLIFTPIIGIIVVLAQDNRTRQKTGATPSTPSESR